MDALNKLLDRVDGLSVVDAALVLVIFLLIRERIQHLVDDLRTALDSLKCARERITRLEKVLIGKGFFLGKIEEE